MKQTLLPFRTNLGCQVARPKLFTLRYGDNRFAEKQLFDFTLPNGLPARGWVGDIGFGELSIHVAVKPKGDWVRAANAGFSAGDAFATTWLEREH
jgi:hypothetical protein